MKAEEFKAKSAEILANLGDQAKVSTILAELTEVYDKGTMEIETMKKTVDTLTTDNENIRKANLKLFLKIGEQKPVEQQKANEDTTPKYEDLFDTNGNLK